MKLFTFKFFIGVTLLAFVNIFSMDAFGSFGAFDIEEELTCSVTNPSISSSNGCCTVSSTPYSNGGDVEWMWARNVNGSIQPVTGWSTNQQSTFCPSEAGYYRICSRVVGCSTIHETGDAYCEPQTCGTLDGIYFYDQSTDQPAYGPIQNDEEIDINSLPDEYYLVAQTSGNIESVTWWVDGFTATENVVLYTFPNGADGGTNWSGGVGIHNLDVNAYNEDSGNGDHCGQIWLSFEITEPAAVCDNSVLLDQWNATSSCEICEDDFTSNATNDNGPVPNPSYGGIDGDEISFQDPICNPDECITGVFVTFNVAATDFEFDQDENDIQQLDIDYPIEINNQVIGTFDPTELPYSCNLCEPENSRTVFFSIDPNSFNYYVGGTNELDINFYEYGVNNNTLQDICVANVTLQFVTEACQTPCMLNVELGDNQAICANESITIDASISGESSCATGCEYELLPFTRCNSGGPEPVYIASAPGGSGFSSNDAQFIEYSDGTAKFTATASNGTDNLIVDITYSNKTTISPIDSPKENVCESTDTNGWTYYQTTSGTITSENHGVYTITRKGPSFQLGNTAIHVVEGYGASGWFYMSGGDGTYEHGDINIKLDPICTPLAGNNEVTYVWSTGETGSSITVSNPGTYSVTATDCAGCVANDEITIDELPSELEIKNLGDCIVDLYEWLPSGDQFVIELGPGESYTVTTEIGAMWRLVGDNWNLDAFDESYTVEECGNDLVWNVEPTYCDPDCELEVDLGPDQIICEGEEITLNATYTNESDCTEIIACYTMTNSTASCGVTSGTGIIWQRGEEGEGCSGSHLIWQAGPDLKLTEYADGTANISGSVTRNGQIGIVDVNLFDKANNGNTWSSSCYTSGLSGNQTYYTSFLGTVTVDGTAYTIEEKTSEKHYILGNGAGFGNDYGLGSWTSGTFGTCTEWFAQLHPCEIPNQELTYLWSTGETTSSINVSETGTYSVVVTDCAGCIASDEITISEKCTNLSGSAPSDITISCDDTLPTQEATFTSDCEFEVTPNETTISLDCGYQLIKSWTAIDECDNELIVTQTITIIDDTFPTGTAPADITLECDEELPNDEPSFSDNCDSILDITSNETQNDLDCGYEIIRTWTATDDCGNSTSVTQTITIIDSTSPSGNDLSDISVDCEDELPNEAPIFTDNCDNDLEITSNETQNELDCGYQLIRTWYATDNCGNVSESITQTITVTDSNAPIIDDSQLVNLTLECIEEVPSALEITATDNCGNATVTLAEDIIEDGCEITITRTWTATDECGNFSTASQTISVADITNPEAQNVPADASVECDEDIPNDEPTFSDNCDNDLEVSFNEEIVNNGSGCGYQVNRTWTATDDCGNSLSVSQIISVIDTTNPTGLAPADVTIECDEELPNDQATFSDNCDSDLDVTSDETQTDLDCGYQITRTWTATDDCGNSASVSQTITVLDTTNPTGVAPADATVECDEDIPNDQPSFSDNCDNNLDISLNETQNDLDCGYEIVKTWTATDACGNSAVVTQTITVVDTTNPTGVAPADISVECDEDIPNDQPVFSDNCDNDLDISADEIQNDLDCGYEIVKTWIATDDCGNSVSVSQTISVIDTTNPDGAAPADMTIECGEELPNEAPSFSDNCDNDLEIATDEVQNDLDCGYEIVKTWTATDDCGNSISVSQTITVVDTTAPILSDYPEDYTVQCIEEILPADQLEAFDSCSEVTLEFVEDPAENFCGDGVRRTWTATDECGNQTVHIQSIFVNDTTPPTVEDLENINIECGDDIPDLEPIFSDNCTANITVELEENSTTINCGIELTRTWTGTDMCGNSTSTSQVITITDSVAPELNGVPEDSTVECDNIPDPALVSANDICDGIVSVEMDEIVSEGCPYTITRTYTASDACGNSTSASETITVIDSSAPILNGIPEDVQDECSDVPSAPQVSATDNCDNDVEVVLEEDVIGESCPLTVVRTWTATDDCGNSSSATQTIVINDTQAPEILNAPEDLTVECTEVPDAIELEVSDNCDIDPEIVFNEDIVDQSCGYVIIRTYTVTDMCGNEAFASYTINVTDSTAPIFDNLPQDETVLCGELEDAPMIYASDACDEEVDVNLSQFGYNGTDCSGTLTRVWTAIDDCGNEATHTQIISIIDTIAPVFSSFPEDYTVECMEDILPAEELEATDNCSDVTIDFVEDPAENYCGDGVRRTWTATDECGNQTIHIQSIFVNDTTAPSVTEIDDLELECGDDIPDNEPTFSDNCNVEITVTFEEISEEIECGVQITRTWTGTDLCGNATTADQVITITDSTAPVLSNLPEDMTVDCAQIPAPAEVDATDICDGDVEVEISEETSEGCPYTITRTYTAMDDCGNSISHSQVITVEDNENPVLVGVPEDINDECSDVPNAPNVTATDNCDSDIEVILEEELQGNVCPLTVIRTWTATDACGNSTSATQSIVIDDTMAPVINSNLNDTIVECPNIPDAITLVVSDNCDSDPTIQFNEEVNELDCGLEIIRSYTVIDLCGNSTSAQYTVTVVDTQAPELSQYPADTTVTCENVPGTPAVSAFDQCSGDLTVTFSQFGYNGTDCEGQLTRSWIVEDDCGNVTSHTQIVTIVDNEAPVLVQGPEDVTASCDEDVAVVYPTFSDNCDDEVEVSLEEITNDLDCGFEILRTFTATDDCGNQTEFVQTLSFIDEEAPVLSDYPEDATVQCIEEVPAAAEITATDNCGEPLLEFVEDPADGFCGNGIRRTWTATDECGNQTIHIQSIFINDTIAPEVSEILDVQIECGDEIPNDEPVFIDNCANELDIEMNENTTEINCGVQITRTWTAIDHCGNQTVSDQVITITDSIAPELFGVPEDESVECNQIPGPASVTATDICDGELPVEIEESISDGCPYTVTRTYTAIDACGNETSATHVITVSDSTAPVLLNLPEDYSAECGEAPEAPEVIAEDNCSENLEVIYTETVVNTNCPIEIVRTWSTMDACGNMTEASQNIFINDETAPELIGVPENITVECDNIPDAAEVSATDNCDSIDVVFNEEISEGCPYTITRTWTATDNCGNTSEASQVISVNDSSAPVLMGIPEDISDECSDVPSAPNVTASDNCDSNVEVILTEETIGNACPLTVIRTWTAEDACGNIAQASQTIVIDDTVAPVIVTDLEDITVECTDVPEPLEIEVSDNCDVDPDVTFNEEVIMQSCGYVIVRTYYVEDLCGNETFGEYTVNVVDTQAPVLSELPENITVSCENVPNPPSISASDACDEDISVNLSQFGYNGTDCEGQLTRVWTAEDACGNEVSHTQIVTIIDETAPTLVEGLEDLNLTCEDELPTNLPVYEDNCDDDVSVSVEEVTNDLACGFEIIRTFTAIDDCGNTSTSNQTVTITDQEDPVLNGVPESAIVECDSIPDAPEVTATDDCSEVEVEMSEQVGTGCPYTITRVWTATDECGNTTSATQILTIEDTSAPEFSSLPEDVTVECDAIPEADELTATDNCSDVELTFSEQISNGCPYQIVRTWTASDNCGNTSEHIQTISVIDTQAPVLNNVPEDYIAECGEAPALVPVTAIDNCTANIVVVYNEVINNAACPISITRTWTATDECGNISEHVQNILISDEEAPVLSELPQDETVECDAIPAPAQVTASDNCSVVDVILNEVQTDGCPYQIIRTWSAEDACGNGVSHTQTITVQDTTAPVLDGIPDDFNAECGDLPEIAQPTATDNCGTDILITFNEEVLNESCPLIIERTWTATDACGNNSSATQTITFNDETAPVLSATPEDVAVECDDIPDPVVISATDNCDNAPEVEYNEVMIGQGCSYELIRTWTATDECGNASQYIQTITVTDTENPIASNEPADVTIECGDALPEDEPSFTDNCDENLNVNFSEETIPAPCGEILVRQWIATDLCGNNALVSQVITITDTTAPSVAGPENVSIDCSEDLPTDEPLFTDICDAELSIELNEEVNDSSCGYVLTRTWTAEDACGNSAEFTQEITVTDGIAPSLSAPEDATVECDAIPAPGTPSASDLCDEELDITFEETIGTGCPYTIVRTWTATDDCGNSTSASQTLTVVDTESPVLVGVPEDATIDCASIPEAALVTATDNCTEATVVLTEETNFDECPYVLTRTWTATDACGNTTSASQMLTIIDNEEPVLIDFEGAINVQCDQSDEIYIQAEDNCTEVTISIVQDLLFSGNCYGTIERTYLIEDECGNSFTTIQYLFLEDDDAPVFDSTPQEEITILCGMDIPEPDALTATDNCDENVNISVSEEITNNGNCPYEIIRTYSALDACGNQTDFVQTVIIIANPLANHDDIVITSAPNPFTSNNRVTMTVPEDGYVQFSVVNTLGQEMEMLIEGELEAEILYEFELQTGNWEDGIYYLKLFYKDNFESHKILKVK